MQASTIDQKHSELTEQLSLAVKAREISEMERQLGILELQSSEIREGWGDLINPSDWLNNDPDFSFRGVGARYAKPDDRKNGDNAPFWTTEQELAEIRGIAEFIANKDEVAIGALENLANYTIHTGFEYKVKDRDEQKKAPEGLVHAVQSWLDRTIKANQWEGDLEREIFKRSRTAGMALLDLKLKPGGNVKIRVNEPSWLTEPQEKRELENWLEIASLDWKYGVATEPGDATDVVGYFVQRHGDLNDWKFLEPERS